MTNRKTIGTSEPIPKSVGIAINGHRGEALCRILSRRNDYKISWSLSPKSTENQYIRGFSSEIGIIIDTVTGSTDLKLLGSNLSKVDYLICSGFPYKIPVQILETASVIAINCHGGPLPSYRGGSPVMWQIINNEKFIGLTIHELTSEFDQGDILMERSLPNISYLDIREVQLLVNRSFEEMLSSFFKNPKSYIDSKKPQSIENARYWHQRNESDGLIDWRRLTAEDVNHFVRALSSPYPGGYNYLSDGEILRIWKVEVDSVPVLGVPGRVVVLSDGLHVVASGNSSVKLIRLDCNRRLKQGDFLNSERRLP